MKSVTLRFLVIAIGALSLAGCGNGSLSPTSPLAADLHILITSQNGVPLSGAKVVSQEQPGGQLKITGLTDSEGSVTFNGIKTGAYTIDISRFDYDPVQITREISATDHDFTVSLKPSTTTPLPSSGPTVSFNDLITQPASFNNKTVTVDAYYFSGFEISALTSGLVTSAYNPSNVVPVQPLVWVTGNLGQSVYQNLKPQTTTAPGYTEYYGHVRVTGIFMYGDHYGHLDAYSFLITVTGAVILP